MDWISLSFVNGYAKILEKALLDTVIRIDLMISEEGENTMAKTKVICFTNNKGGSGKTTTCSNVGFGLRELGKKVLMIDGDMQLNLSLSLFDEDTVLAYAQSDKNLYEAIKRQDDLTDYIVASRLHQEMVSFQHPAEEDEAEELFAHDISEVMEDMVRTELGMVQKPVAYMQKEDKLSIVGNLANRGIFDVKGSVEYVAECLGVTNFTVYNYLKELRVKNK